MKDAKRVLEYYSPTVTFHFERGHIACAYCPALETYARAMCRMTGEYIVDTKGLGGFCPFRDEAIDYDLNVRTKELTNNEDV